MTPLILGALLLSGNTLFNSIKESNKFDTLKQEEQDNLNQILEKKRLMYIKSGLKITGSVLGDLNNIKKNKTKKNRFNSKTKRKLFILFYTRYAI